MKITHSQIATLTVAPLLGIALVGWSEPSPVAETVPPLDRVPENAAGASLAFPVPTPGEFATASFAEAADFVTSQCNVREERDDGSVVWSTSDMTISADGSVGLTSTTPGRRKVPVSFHVKDVYVYDLSDSVTLEVRTEIFGTDKIGPRLIAAGDRRVDVATIYCNEWQRVPQAFAQLRALAG